MSCGLLNLDRDLLGIPERADDILEGLREGDLQKGQWVWRPWRLSVRLGDLLGKPAPTPGTCCSQDPSLCFLEDACRLHGWCTNCP